MQHTAFKAEIGLPEFVILMAAMMSLVALSIDAMLPAMAHIGADLGVAEGNQVQLILSVLFFGLACGQIIYGPLSDSTGRKPAIMVGFGLYLCGCVLSLLAENLDVMLLGRFLQGLGVAAPRIVSMALVRDMFAGPEMARVMSFIMSVFILVPAIAPALGQGILFFAHWRFIFASFLVLAAGILVWFMLRQPETLPAERRQAFSLRRIGRAVREILGNRLALGYTLAAGCITSAFLGYLTSSQPVFQELYGLGAWFPLCFAALALAVGLASIVNGRLVVTYGMQRMCRRALGVLVPASVLFLGAAFLYGGHPPLWQLMAYLALAVFCTGILFGNLNAMAMEPLGHIAGVGAAVIGSLSTLIAVPLGSLVGLSFNHTVYPLVGGFAVFGLLSIGLMRRLERG